ncbi:MAG TPA: ATP-binding cassette domain-containing protein [Sporichthyaceae bacterium]|jgi:daunorubicin resistance ABC transporter ATP-binding subunit|nr:ATP-binding cassette domain-containing protein [Sporichthyaceae bacterium]
MIEAQGLTKRYGDTTALAGLDLFVEPGSVLGVLGPNGAGKTTLTRVLTTLTVPDSGTARVAGLDVVRQAGAVRACIGVTAQDTTLDEVLTGRQNLVLIGELSCLGRAAARQRAGELLERFGLRDAADRPLGTYSGGMRRRLDLAATLVTHARVLFLDEPTTGLDPGARAEVWSLIKGLVNEGTTLLLTTQYLAEADELADRIVVIDHGKVIASGSPIELKDAAGAARLEVTLSHPSNYAVAIITPYVDGGVRISPDGLRLQAAVRERAGMATTVVRALDAAGITVDDVSVRPPSLDDVFLALTGHPASEL